MKNIEIKLGAYQNYLDETLEGICAFSISSESENETNVSHSCREEAVNDTYLIGHVENKEEFLTLIGYNNYIKSSSLEKVPKILRKLEKAFHFKERSEVLLASNVPNLLAIKVAKEWKCSMIMYSLLLLVLRVAPFFSIKDIKKDIIDKDKIKFNLIKNAIKNLKVKQFINENKDRWPDDNDDFLKLKDISASIIVDPESNGEEGEYYFKDSAEQLIDTKLLIDLLYKFGPIFFNKNLEIAWDASGVAGCADFMFHKPKTLFDERFIGDIFRKGKLEAQININKNELKKDRYEPATNPA